MGNEQNLIPNSERTPEELREMTRKGGIASGVARRRKRTFKEILEQLGSLPIKSEQNRKILEDAGVENVEELTNDMAIMFRLNQKASNGDLRAIELLAKLRKQLTDQVEFNDITPPQPLSPRKAKKEEK